MKSFKITLVLLFLCGVVSAQEYRLNISVVNAENGEPVPYATILYVQQEYGFSANTAGRFTIRVNKVEFERKLNISSIGFEPYTTTLGALVRDTVSIIELKPKITILDELMIRAEAETPLSIVKKAAKGMPDFLGSSPYYLHMFYKETLKKRDKHIGFTEGYGIMHMTSFAKAQRTKSDLFKMDLVQWKNIRRSHYDLMDDCDTLKSRTLSINKLLKAKIQYLYRGPLNKDYTDDYKFNIDSLTSFQGHEVFIVGFQPKRWDNDTQYKGHIYVKADDYAMLALKIQQLNSKNVIFRKCDIDAVKSDFDLSYTYIEGKYYLNRLSMKNSYGGIEEEISIRGGNFQNNKVGRLNYDQRVVLYSEMINPAVSYKSDFWEDHGDEIPEKIVTDLSGNTSLSDQFKDHIGKRMEALPPKFKSYQSLYSNSNLFKLYFSGDL